jgi:hypothetical protein
VIERSLRGVARGVGTPDDGGSPDEAGADNRGAGDD